MNTFKNFLPLVILGALLFSACQNDGVDPVLPKPDGYSSEVPLAWNQLYLNVERYTPGYRPPVSARTSGYIGLIAYESIVWATARKLYPRTL